ncbi:MAG: hypothetical protein V1492_03365 [Candidatus Micrarchaeota archaeon]
MSPTTQTPQPAVAAKSPSVAKTKIGNWFRTHAKPLVVGAVLSVAITTAGVMANRHITQTEATAVRQEQLLKAHEKQATKTDTAIEDLEGAYLDLGDSVNAKVPVISLNYVPPKKEQYDEVGLEDIPVCEKCTCESEPPVFTIAPVFTITGTKGGKIDNSFANYVMGMLLTPEKTTSKDEIIPSGEEQLRSMGCELLANGTDVTCNSLSSVKKVCEEAQPSDTLSCFGGALERLAGEVKLAIDKAAMVYVGLLGNGDCDKGYVRLKEGTNLYTVTAYRETGTHDCASASTSAGEAPKQREAAFKTGR